MARSSLALAPAAPVGCSGCAFRSTCGGLEGQQSMFGCFSSCWSCGVAEGKCDYTCPRKPGFWRDWAEVGGLTPRPRRPLPALGLDLPWYVPMVRHGYSRCEALPLDVVALGTFDVLDTICQPRVEHAEQLRDRFLVAPHAQVLLVSVNPDRQVESFWAHRTPDRLASLAQLGVAAMTTPNFSFFDDAPRLHSVRNFWRTLRAAEDLADAGITPVLHVNALCRADWKRWANVLRDNPSVCHVCKEFQTGLTDPQRAADAIEGLRWLQDEIGRPIHPLIVGGRRVAHLVARHFSALTVVDSVPFLAAVKRRRIVSNGADTAQLVNPTSPGELLDELLQHNIRTYSGLVARCAGSELVGDLEGLDDDER